MSFYGSRIPHFIEAKNEDELRIKLLETAASLGQKLELVNIYHNATKNRVVAWYFHDIKAAPLPSTNTVKKKAKKKVVKKKA